MIGLVILSIVVIGALMLIMAVGLLRSRPSCLRGSCGGLDTLEAAGHDLRCRDCPLVAGARPTQRSAV